MKFDFCVIGITFYLATFTNAVPINGISPQGVAGVVIPGKTPTNPTVANARPANYPPANHVNPAQAPGSYYVSPATIPPPPSAPVQLSSVAQPAQAGSDVLTYLSTTISQSSPQALDYVSKAMPASIDLPKFGDE